MNLVAWLFFQLLSYGLWWAVFIAIAVVGAKKGRWLGIFAGHCVIAVMILFLDIAWIRSEMSKPGWSPDTGPDMDIVFDIGVLARIILVNLTLMPLSIFFLRKKKEPNQAPEPTAPSGRGSS